MADRSLLMERRNDELKGDEKVGFTGDEWDV